MSGDLCVFLVDNGSTHEFSVERYVGAQVELLQRGIFEQLGIPPESQVLIMDGGVQLQPNRTLAQYSCGTGDSNPIFLFSKDTIQSTTLPSASVYNSNSSFETNEIKCELERLLTHQGASIELVSSRTQLASRVVSINQKLTEESNSLVRDQSLQHQGWLAVVENLEKYTSSFSRQAQLLFEQVEELQPQLYYCQQLLQGLPEIIEKLKSLRLPISVLDKTVSPSFSSAIGGKHLGSWLLSRVSLADRAGGQPKIDMCSFTLDEDIDPTQQQSGGQFGSEEGRPQNISLYDFLVANNAAFDLELCGTELQQVLENYSPENIQLIQMEVDKITSLAGRVDMKRIGNFQSRLEELDSKLKQSEKLTQRQSFILDAFVVNNERLQAVGDRSVLSDLCDMHSQQLREMAENHHRVMTINNSTKMAKDELSHNLHTRLKWIMKVQEMIVQCESQVTMKRENLRRLTGRVKILEQSKSAPEVILIVIQEILRRRKFSSAFMKWGANVSENSREVLMREIEKRKLFTQKVSSHFIYNVMSKLWEDPPPFALEEPVFDVGLPEVEEKDVLSMFQTLPEFDHLRDSDATNTDTDYMLPHQEDFLFPDLNLGNAVSSHLHHSQDTVTDESTCQAQNTDTHMLLIATKEIATQTCQTNLDETTSTIVTQTSSFDPTDEFDVTKTEGDFMGTVNDVMKSQGDLIRAGIDVMGTENGVTRTGIDVMRTEEAVIVERIPVSEEEFRQESKGDCLDVFVPEETSIASENDVIANLCSQIKNRVLQNKSEARNLETRKCLAELIAFLTSTGNNFSQEQDLELQHLQLSSPACTRSEALANVGCHLSSDDNLVESEREGQRLDSLDSETGSSFLKGIPLMVTSSCQASSSSDVSHAECQTEEMMVTRGSTASCEDLPSQSLQIQAEHQTAFNRALNALSKEKNSEIIRLRSQVKKMNAKLKHLEDVPAQTPVDAFKTDKQSLEISCQVSDDFSEQLAALGVGKGLDRGIDIPNSGGRSNSNQNSLPIEIMNSYSTGFDRHNTLIEGNVDDLSGSALGRDFGLNKTFGGFGLSFLSEDQSAMSQYNKAVTSPSGVTSSACVTQSVITVPPSAANENSSRNMLALSNIVSTTPPKHSFTTSASTVGIPTQIKIAVNDFRPNDLILVLYDESSAHYRIFSITNTLYFLHYDSFPDFQIANSPESRRLKYVGVFVSKELCKVRKTTNRFNLDVGQKFYRVKAMLWRPHFPSSSKADR